VSVLRQVAAIMAKDLLIEWRTRDLLSTMVVLGFTSIVLFNFAFDFGRLPYRQLGAPVLWVAFLFTGVAGLARAFGLERENRCIDGILLAPVDRSVLYVGKLLVNFLVLTVLALMLLGFSMLLLNQGSGRVEIPGSRWPVLLGIVALNTLGFAAVGTLFALLAQRTRRGEVLLPVLQSILTLPVLVAAVLATGRVLDASLPLSDIWGLVKLSAAFDVVFTCVFLVIFEYVVEE
jgi:heme exporter protein B